MYAKPIPTAENKHCYYKLRKQKTKNESKMTFKDVIYLDSGDSGLD